MTTQQPTATPAVVFVRQRPLAAARQLPWILPLLGLGAWTLGVISVHRTGIGSYGLLASGSPLLVVGFVLLLAGFVLELRRPAPRTAVLMLQLAGLIVAIHATVPILYGAPAYDWVYKHIGIAAAFARFGHITDPTNIYQQWPAMFAALAAISSLAHVNALSFAAWAPLAFELADAMLLLALFRLLGGERRIAWLAVLLYEGAVAWVGQDYLSPQAFAYLLWLALLLIVLRWLRAPLTDDAPRRRLARWGASLTRDLPAVPEPSMAMRVLAGCLVVTIEFAIVAAHQLTPYIVLPAIAALTVLGAVRPPWLVLVLAAITGAYLAPRIGFISTHFGGLFSGLDPFANAAGVSGSVAPSAGARLTARSAELLGGGVWLAAMAVVIVRRREGGRVMIPALLAFTPFLILGVQSYGGEAIYRVYMFSAPWCSLLIASALFKLRARWRWGAVALVSAALLFLGLEGLYGQVAVDAFTPTELDASLWLYGHAPSGSTVVLPVKDFPAQETANYRNLDVEVMPSDPQVGKSWLDERDSAAVSGWIASLRASTVYVVVSHSMQAWADFYGAPRGYDQFARRGPVQLGGVLVYHNRDASIYRLPTAAQPDVTPAAGP